jgi:uncharacterized protein
LLIFFWIIIMTEPLPNLSRSAALKGIILLLLVLYLFTVNPFFYTRVIGLTALNSTSFLISRLMFWIIIVLLWLYTAKVEKQPLLLWKEEKHNFLFYLLSVIVMFLVLIIGLFFIHKILVLAGLLKKSMMQDALIAIFKTNIPLLVFTCLTAGIGEEIIFRGYLLPRFEILFKNPWLAIIVSSLSFGLAHIRYGTVGNVAGPVFIGSVFAYHYWKFRNIKLIMAFHFLWDLCLLLISVSHTS